MVKQWRLISNSICDLFCTYYKRHPSFFAFTRSRRPLLQHIPNGFWRAGLDEAKIHYKEKKEGNRMEKGKGRGKEKEEERKKERKKEGYVRVCVRANGFFVLNNEAKKWVPNLGCTQASDVTSRFLPHDETQVPPIHFVGTTEICPPKWEEMGETNEGRRVINRGKMHGYFLPLFDPPLLFLYFNYPRLELGSSPMLALVFPSSLP